MKRILLLALAGGFGLGAHAATATATATATNTLRYDIYMDNGQKAGEQVVTLGDDGVTRVRYVYKNNGRGPELDETYRVGADGTYTDYAVKGKIDLRRAGGRPLRTQGR